MVKFSEKNLLRHYFGFSFYSAAFLWMSLFLAWGVDFWSLSFFASTLVVGTAFAYFHGINYLASIDSFASKKLPFYFLFQSILFVAMSLETSITAIMYFTLFPSLTYILTVRHENDRKKGIALFGICIGTYTVFSTAAGNRTIGLNEVLFLLFGIFSLGLMYFASVSPRGKNFMSTFFGSSGENQSDYREHRKDDQLFFHDLINQTHGLHLFFNHKLATSESLDQTEIKNVLKEVSLIQSLIKDHYGMIHKNLSNIHRSISYAELKDILEGIMHTYLEPGKVAHKANYAGWFENGVETCNIHYPALVRIFTNLVKNVAESGSEEVFFNFDYQIDGLRFVVRNRIFNMHEDRHDVNDNLHRIIMSIDGSKQDRDGEKLGLESVSFLVDSFGGQFNFSIDGEYWVAEVFLPDSAEYVQSAA